MASLLGRLHLPAPSRALEALERAGTSPWRLARSALIATLGTVFQLVSLALFLPLIRGMLGAPGGGGRFGRWLPLDLPQGGEPGRHLTVMVVLILVATAGRVTCGYWSTMQVARDRAVAESKLSALLVRRFLGLGQAYYDGGAVKKSVGLAQRLPGQAARAVQVLHDGLVALANLALLFTALFLLSWQLALVAMVTLIVYNVFYDKAAERLETMAEELEDAEEESGIRTHDLLSNLPLVHGHRARDREADAHAGRAARLASLRIGQDRLLGLLDPLRDTVAVLLLLGFAGLVAALPQSVAAAGVTRYLVFLLVFRRALSSASRLLRFPQRWRRQEKVLQRLEELDGVEAAFVVPSGSRAFPGLRQDIVTERLSFTYPGGREVLHDLSIRFAAGRRTWVVGESGSGKSTLLKLLMRLYDCAPAAIRLDGVDLRELSTSSLLERMAWAPSEPLFFADTVRANLTYGLERPSDADIWRLADTLAIGDLLRELPAMLDTDLGERGLRFSTGERQRLALVRVFLREPEIVLIDEATAGVDAATEARLLEALDRLTAGRTVIVVAHRLSNLRAHEEVVVLQDGRAAEHGSRDELLATSGVLSQLWSAQGLPLPAELSKA